MKALMAIAIAAALAGCGTAGKLTMPDMFKHQAVEVPAGSGSE